MLRNHVALWASVFVLALFFTGHYVFGRDNAKIVVDSLVIGAAVTISLTWFRATSIAVREGFRDGAANILVSVWLIWTVLLGFFGWVVYYQAMGRPEWLRLSPVSGTFSCLIFLAGAYAILVPVNDTATLPTPSMVRGIVGVGVGMFVAGSLMTLAFLKIVNFG